MTAYKLFGITLGVALIGGALQAQDWSIETFLRAIETPAHDVLMEGVQQPGVTLVAFETDGCSGGLSQAWRAMSSTFPKFAEAHQSRPPWEDCCVTHDRAYNNAGGALEAAASFDARLAADTTLRSCVTASAGDRVEALSEMYDLSAAQIESAYAQIAQTMFLVVRFGGAPCTDLPWRWGFGYPSC